MFSPVSINSSKDSTTTSEHCAFPSTIAHLDRRLHVIVKLPNLRGELGAPLVLVHLCPGARSCSYLTTCTRQRISLFHVGNDLISAISATSSDSRVQ